jgi:hypothetical protein
MVIKDKTEILMDSRDSCSWLQQHVILYMVVNALEKFYHLHLRDFQNLLILSLLVCVSEI